MTARECIEWMLNDARRVYHENKRAGSPALSLAYDSGRVAGLKEALDAVVRNEHRTDFLDEALNSGDGSYRP